MKFPQISKRTETIAFVGMLVSVALYVGFELGTWRGAKPLFSGDEPARTETFKPVIELDDNEIEELRAVHEHRADAKRQAARDRWASELEDGRIRNEYLGTEANQTGDD